LIIVQNILMEPIHLLQERQSYDSIKTPFAINTKGATVIT
jgi:hypothetical protein